jgi:putative membrane protein
VSFIRAMSLAPAVVLPLAAALLLYLIGVRRLPRDRLVARSGRRAAFLAGWLTLAAALISPLHELGESLFSAHMGQHELLMVVAAPLLAWARPLAPMLRALPGPWRIALGRLLARATVRSVSRTLSAPAVAFALQAAGIWVWHTPALFQSTLRSEPMHAAQHLTFFGTALVFWWSLVHRRGGRDSGLGLLSLFLTILHTGALGALLSLSTVVYYPAYGRSAAAWGLTPLEDQQLGGLIMWIPGGIAYVVAALGLVAAWLRQSERRSVRALSGAA